MTNNYFRFKQFTIYQDKAAFKVGTDGVLLGACADVTGVHRILDVGTGTGLIALMLAQRSDAKIIAIEPDSESFMQASENVMLSSWKERIKVENIDLQGYRPGIKFDLIVSNPPYFDGSVRNPDHRKANTRHNISLINDDLLGSVSALIEDSGKFQLILPYVEGNIFIAEAQAYGLYCNNIIKIRPLPTSEIKRLILTFSKQRSRVQEKFLTIEHGRRHDYTEEYKNLTREYYLKF